MGMMTAKPLPLLLLLLLQNVAAHIETVTLVTGVPVPTIFGPETFTGYTSIFTNGTSNETIGTFSVGCSLITTNPTFQFFSPCINIFTFYGPDGTIATSEDSLMIDGVSILASLANTTQPPQLQKFAIIGGLGKYVDAVGSMSVDFSTFPGRSTYTVSINAHETPTLAGETIVAGFVPPTPNTSFFVNGYTSIYNPSNLSQSIGSFALVCPKIIYQGLDTFMNCMMLFYFYNETEGIGSTQDTIVATGLSAIANLSDLTQPLVLQNYAISGGTGKYKGIKGSLSNNFGTNPGLNTFSSMVVQDSSGRNRALAESGNLWGEPNPSATRGLQEQPSMVLSVRVFPPANRTEVFTGFGAMYNSSNLDEAIGTFTIACFIFNNSDIDLFNPCLAYFYFHGVDGIQTTENGFMAFGWDIVANTSELTQPPISQLGTLIGGFGTYESVTGYVVRGLGDVIDRFSGYNTFSVYLDPAPTPSAPTPSAPAAMPAASRPTSSGEKPCMMGCLAIATLGLTLVI